MKLVHNIKITVFSHDGEDYEKIDEKLKSFLPMDLEKEKLSIKKTIADGFNEKKIVISELFITKEKHVTAVLKSLNERLSDDTKRLIIRQAESRTDDECRFFLRFDKSKLLDEDRLWLTDSGNCYHIAMAVAAYPAKKEKAVEAAKKIFHTP